jgi:queuine tRNA-ribosyltransferase
MPTPFRFSLEKTDSQSRARAGLFSTPHGDIRTPVFAPVGTQGTVKTLSPDELTDLGAYLILANTYHLYLRPGADVVQRLGGLHRFMAWPGPILTDSGGFQVFSLSGLRKISNDGVTFRSHIDGSEHFFSPEKSVQVQEALGADIIMAFDECPDPMDYDYNVVALRRTHGWAARCQKAQTRSDQALFGIVQGGIFPELREESARFLSALDLSGYAIGGLSVGEPKAKTIEMLDLTVPLLPPDKPRYLMGVGSPEDLFSGVERGIDIFDCALPTRLARNGALFTSHGRINLRNAVFAGAEGPIEEGCTCYTCQRFSMAYLHHLYKAEEILGLRLNTLHNVHFLLELMRNIRSSILQGTFAHLKAEFVSRYIPVQDDAQRRENLSQRRDRKEPAAKPGPQRRERSSSSPLDD